MSLTGLWIIRATRSFRDRHSGTGLIHAKLRCLPGRRGSASISFRKLPRFLQSHPAARLDVREDSFADAWRVAGIVTFAATLNRRGVSGQGEITQAQRRRVGSASEEKSAVTHILTS